MGCHSKCYNAEIELRSCEAWWEKFWLWSYLYLKEENTYILKPVSIFERSGREMSLISDRRRRAKKKSNMVTTYNKEETRRKEEGKWRKHKAQKTRKKKHRKAGELKKYFRKRKNEGALEAERRAEHVSKCWKKLRRHRREGEEASKW